ncbi:hypothetical protein [Hymenobacter sp.]|jgi:hypothetical protein|uniref:hypothetical protein n=1 Tax=Hymenobacter sp. TaxID=1898978 RepID=UPI002ED8192E
MILARYYKVLFLVGISLNISCIKSKSEEKNAILTGNGKGKYWDIIGSKNGLDRYNPAIKKSFSYRDAGAGLPKDCDFFGRNNKLLHYHNIDSIKIIDPHVFADDVFYNPDDFFIEEDSIKMSGFKYKIIHLDEELLVVKRMYKGKSILIFYVPSKWQGKTECKTLDCK